MINIQKKGAMMGPFKYKKNAYNSHFLGTTTPKVVDCYNQQRLHEAC